MELIDKKIEKRWKADLKKFHILNSIMRSLRECPQSIAKLSRKLEINRSTLRYYLNELKEDNQIIMSRKPSIQAQPTIIEINEEHFKKQDKEFRKRAEEYVIRMEKDPYVHKVLEELSRKGRITKDEMLKILSDFEKNNPTPTATSITALDFLEKKNAIVNYYEMKPEGKKFLKENKK